MTRDQLQTLEFIKTFISKNRYSPTCNEIAAATNTCQSAAWRMVQRLIRSGYLEKEDTGKRYIKVREAA